MATPLTFENWRSLLRNDCIALDKLPAFNTLGDGVLMVLYNNGLDPTVASIVAHGLNGKSPATDR